MMLRKKSSRWTGARVLLLLPLTALALGAFAETVYLFPEENVKLNHYIAVFERVVLLCKICEQQTSNRIESLAIESGCIRE